MFKFALIALALALGAQAWCDIPDETAPTCQISEGSPTVSDCQDAVDKLSGIDLCLATNGSGSRCVTVGKSGSCKIDACSNKVNVGFAQPGDCRMFLNNIIGSCQSKGKVGGFVQPEDCSLDSPLAGSGYKVQFSKA
jgi:hypothetical protein